MTQSKNIIKVEEKHLLVSHVSQGNGNIKCFIKLPNVRRQMKMTDPLQTSVVTETRTPESHPFICPFADPLTNTPCTAMFKKTEQRCFEKHRSKNI